ncbi:MAG: PEP-CTERM sorting domain-containing protein [Cyanobacteria bacterium SBLK]|nr:PEP-CTERM sorting domain-containing protein [Cyanobacteria bacterium SBLK]
MQKQLLKTLIGSAIAGVTLAIATPANAGTLHTKTGFDIEWNYSIDQVKDGYSRNPNILNYSGMALAETDDQFIFALSSDLNYDETYSLNDTPYTHGDLFLNFSGEKFQTANDGNTLFAVRFAPENNTNTALGLYEDVVAGTIDGSHWDSLMGYYANGNIFPNRSFGTDLSSPNAVYDYFYSLDIDDANNSNTPLYNGIQSGTKIGDVSMLDVVALEALGLDLAFSSFNADDVFGIAIDKSLFASIFSPGEFELMAHVTMEYGDGVALQGKINIPEAETPPDGEDSSDEEEPQAVPEPATLLGLSAVGLVFLRCKRSHLCDRATRTK